MNVFDYLIVGSGLYGATCARLLADAGKTVTVIEKRNHLGGNCHDTKIEGVWVNCYGGHIFHTNSERIWKFVSRFAKWQAYEHRVKAYAGGMIYSFPPNRLTAHQLGIRMTDPSAEDIIRRKFFVGYSEKQWGRPYSEIPKSVIRRIPIRDSYDDRYFSDKYQAIPVNGYTRFITDMLDRIPVITSVDFVQDTEYWRGKAKSVIYTGALDELMGYRYGRLEYRSLRHETQISNDDGLGCATMNFCDKAPEYTRVISWRHMGYQDGSAYPTTIEYPASEGERYYPIPTGENIALHKQYELALKDEMPGVHAGGRLGAYKYLNMDQAIGAAMALVGRLADGS
jgi:UDP-galactopyranose mutase